MTPRPRALDRSDDNGRNKSDDKTLEEGCSMEILVGVSRLLAPFSVSHCPTGLHP